MSKLQDLIQKLCPDGVEYKKLGDVCELSRGKVYSKTYIVENAGEYPVYSSQTANNGELGCYEGGMQLSYRFCTKISSTGNLQRY